MINKNEFTKIFSLSQDLWPYYVVIGINTLSLLGSLFVIFIFFFYKKLRCFAFELVVYLSVSSMITSISYIMNWENDPGIILNDFTLCRLQAFLMIWFEISQFLWATLIGYSVYENVIYFELVEPHTPQIKRAVFLMIGFAFPAVFSLLGDIFNFLGLSGNWCWVALRNASIYTKIYGLSIHGFIWCLIFLNLIFTFRVGRYLKKVIVKCQSEENIIAKYIWKLLRYSIIQIICISPSTVYRIVDFIFETELEYLGTISIISKSLQGLLIAIIYGLNPQVYKALSETFSCCKAQSRTISLDESFMSENKEEKKSDLNDF